MALIDCPECGIEISSRAQFCPRCGVPLGRAHPNRPHERGSFNIPVIPMTGLDVVRSIVGRLVVGVSVFIGGAATEDPMAIIGALVVGASCIPLYLKARRAEKRGLAGAGPDISALEDRLERRLLDAEDRVARHLAESDRSSMRVGDVEERLEFLERLLAREREQREGNQQGALPPGRSP